MATLEDKILGEKLHNYCSSSSDDDSSEYESDDDSGKKSITAKQDETIQSEANKWEGTSTNTGPKGVINDWQRYKQLETKKRARDDREKIELMKKLTLTVQSALDEEREKAAQADDSELVEFLNDEFLLTYQKQRMQEMLQQTNHNLKFGELIFLRDSQEFLDAIDKEHKSVTVIVHIYENQVEACCTMNDCLKYLAKTYSNVKFCAILSSVVGMSRKFKIDGIPALLIYKNGQLVGNFIRLSDEFGNDFDAEDVQNYLVEHGMLDDRSCKPLIIQTGGDTDDDDDTD